jgi:hypothetical protein
MVAILENPKKAVLINDNRWKNKVPIIVKVQKFIIMVIPFINIA